MRIKTKSVWNIPNWRWILDSLGERYWKRKFKDEFGFDEGGYFMSTRMQVVLTKYHLV